MAQSNQNKELEHLVFNTTNENFDKIAIEVFLFQYNQNEIYRQYCDSLKINSEKISQINQIPFLPIEFFKTREIKTTDFSPQVVFESSGTTGSINSKHFVKDCSIYERSFNEGYQQFYINPKFSCILGLLPSYLERNNSSLVYMVDALIQQSDNNLSGFYLNDYEKLHRTILHNEILNEPTVLIGVTYALLEFAEKYPMQLRHTIVMETGGMKGRREELTRMEVHQILKDNFGINMVHSEYGMTELLSQAYSKGSGIFHCPPWMKILIREEDDPFAIHIPDKKNEKPVSGAINVIDLANIYSCSFIATSDLGRLYASNGFEVLGRMDHSDIRGCSLMAI